MIPSQQQPQPQPPMSETKHPLSLSRSTTTYAPPVPSPLNPKSSRKSLFFSSLSPPHKNHPLAATSSRPRPSALRRKSSRNISPTQKLLRQKAEMAWRSQTRMNVLMTSPTMEQQIGGGLGLDLGLRVGDLGEPLQVASPTSYRGRTSTVTSVAAGPGGREHVRGGGGAFMGGGVYQDIMDHPNMIALLHDLAKDNPTIMDAHTYSYSRARSHSCSGGDVGLGPGLGFGTGLGMDKDRRQNNPTTTGGYGTRDYLYHSLSSYSLGSDWSISDINLDLDPDLDVSEKDALVISDSKNQDPEHHHPSHCSYPDLEAGTHLNPTQFCADNDGTPLLLARAVAAGEHQQQQRLLRHHFLTPRCLLLIVAVLALMTLYPIARLYPAIVLGSEFQPV